MSAENIILASLCVPIIGAIAIALAGRIGPKYSRKRDSTDGN